VDSSATTGTSSPVERTDQEALSKRLKRSIRRYVKTVLLLLTAVVTALAALFTFRSDPSVFPESRLTSFILADFGDFVPSFVRVYLLPDPRVRGMAVHFYVFNVTAPPTRMLLSTDVSSTRYTFSSWTRYQSGYVEGVRFTLPDIGDNTSRNDEYVAALLPSVEFINDESITNPGADNGLHTIISILIPHADKYAWTSGSPPAFAGRLASWDFLTSATTTTTENGVSLSVQDSNTKLVFISGALLGIAGGALVGAIQEALDDKPEKASEGGGRASRPQGQGGGG
jgi:hypothetical protein